jgi:hypothetical protein
MGHCFKHNMSLCAGDTMKGSMGNVKVLMLILHWIRNPWIWDRLKSHAFRILSFCNLDQEKEANSFPRDTSIHAKVGSAAKKVIATSDLEAAKNSGCLRKPLVGIEIQWLSIERGAADLSNFLQLLASAAVITFGEGLSEKKVKLAASLLSGQALDKCSAALFVRFDVKVQQVLDSFTTPHFILDMDHAVVACSRLVSHR